MGDNLSYFQIDTYTITEIHEYHRISKIDLYASLRKWKTYLISRLHWQIYNFNLDLKNTEVNKHDVFLPFLNICCISHYCRLNSNNILKLYNLQTLKIYFKKYKCIETSFSCVTFRRIKSVKYVFEKFSEIANWYVISSRTNWHIFSDLAKYHPYSLTSIPNHWDNKSPLEFKSTQIDVWRVGNLAHTDWSTLTMKAHILDAIASVFLFIFLFFFIVHVNINSSASNLFYEILSGKIYRLIFYQNERNMKIVTFTSRN